MDFWQNYGLGIFCAVILVLILARVMARPRSKMPLQLQTILVEEAAREAARIEYEQIPKCVCGEVARFPAPVLKRSRGAWDWLRTHFAAPPRYSRQTDMMRVPVFCEAHAHVADAMMDKFIFGIRNEFSSLNAKVAADAAGFEQEALLRCVADSLTESQKRATRKGAATVRLLSVKNGTDDVPSSDGSS
jgi:hypothetical protein